MLVLNPFTLDPDFHSDSHGISFPDPSLTVQADRDASDINNIVKRFGVTGMLPYGNLQPVYDDFTHFPSDYHSALNFINGANDEFMAMPADVRAAFGNDAGSFLDAIADPSQYPKFSSLGLVPPIPPTDPAVVSAAVDPLVHQPKGDSAQVPT